MRFCMLTTFYPPYSFGGDAIFVRDLSAALAESGHDVHVIHCRDAYRALSDHEPAPCESGHPDVTVHSLESPAGALSPLATQQTGLPLFKSRKIQRILDSGFDVIHYHNVSLLGGPGILKYGTGLKLYTCHEYWLVCPTHHLYRNNREACSKRSCVSCSIRYRRPPQPWRATGMLDRAVHHVDAFLFPSRFGMSTHRDLGLDAPMIHLPTFAPKPPGGASAARPKRRPYFLYVGRLEPAKGPQTLVPLFNAWDQADLVIAGAGSMEATLRLLAGHARRVSFEGQVDSKRLAELYRGAIAVIVPSLAFEMFPLVVLEAFREGTPVIARQHGALTEAIDDSGGGLAYNDDDELRSHLSALLSDVKRRNELGKLGQRGYRERWSSEIHLQRYLGIVDELIAGKSRPGTKTESDGKQST